jgi:hypothetical protein
LTSQPSRAATDAFKAPPTCRAEAVNDDSIHREQHSGRGTRSRPVRKPGAGGVACLRCRRSRSTTISSSCPIEQTPTSGCACSSTPSTDARDPGGSSFACESGCACPRERRAVGARPKRAPDQPGGWLPLALATQAAAAVRFGGSRRFTGQQCALTTAVRRAEAGIVDVRHLGSVSAWLPRGCASRRGGHGRAPVVVYCRQQTYPQRGRALSHRSAGGMRCGVVRA